MTHIPLADRAFGFRSTLPALLGLVGMLLVGAAPVGAERAATMQSNYCVECHRRAETLRAFPAWARDQITHWYGAVHGRVGVTCEQCHGGNPRAARQDEAHVGVVSPRKPQSPLYYKRVAEACGRCHADVYRQFTQSHHFEVLKSDHLAPSCTTCHGFEMDMDAVTPVQLVARCALCHNEARGLAPEYQTQAKEALEGSARVERAIERAQWAVEFARDRGQDTTVPQALVENARARLRGTGQLWHRFELGVFTRELKGIQRVADHAYMTAADSFTGTGGEGSQPAPE